MNGLRGVLAVRETPRTARRRILLDLVLQQSPALSAAFRAGALTPCQALELRPLLGGLGGRHPHPGARGP